MLIVFDCFAFFGVYLSENTKKLVFSENFEKLNVRFWTKVKVRLWVLDQFWVQKPAYLVQNPAFILWTFSSKIRKTVSPCLVKRTTKIDPDPNFQNGKHLVQNLTSQRMCVYIYIDILCREGPNFCHFDSQVLAQFHGQFLAQDDSSQIFVVVTGHFVHKLVLCVLLVFVHCFQPIL